MRHHRSTSLPRSLIWIAVFLLAPYASTLSATLVPGSAMPAVGSVQVHPCDVVPPQNPILTNPVRAGFCHAGRNADGSPAVLLGFRVYIDGNMVFEGALSPLGNPTADGRQYFETDPFTVARGNHVLTTSAVSLDGESAPSAPFPFVLDGVVLPAAPTNPRAKK